MGPTINQLNQIAVTRYGMDLRMPPTEPKRADAQVVAEPNKKVSPHSNPPPRAAQSELSRLMRTIAEKTYSEVTAGDLKKSVGKLDKGERNALVELATQAESALREIKNLKVSDIVNEKDGAIERLFNKAAELQFELADRLRENAAKDKFQTAKLAGYRHMLDDLSLKCDARGSEILTLYMEVKTFAEAKAIGGESKLLTAATGDLLKGMAGSMHGNDKSLRFKEETSVLEAQLAEISNSSTVSPIKFQALLAKTAELSTKLKSADVAGTMDPQIHAKLTAHLDTLSAEISDRTQRAVKEAMKGLLKPVVTVNEYGRKLAEVVAGKKGKFPKLHKMFRLLDEMARKGVSKAEDFETITDHLSGLNIGKEILPLHDYLRKEKPELAFDLMWVAEFRQKIGVPLQGIHQARAVYDEIIARRKDGELTTVGDDIVKAFRQDDNLSVLLETRVHGGNAESVDSRFSDANLVSKEKLGSGGVNSVYKLTYKMEDGSTKDFVFKPDVSARTGLNCLVIGAYSSYKDSQQAVKLNVATCDVAEFLGLERLVGKNYATVHDGQYGLLMELAPGSEGEKVSMPATPEAREKFHKRAIMGKLAKELNDLRWLDIATGQGDRHNSNFLVDFGADGKTPKVTGIDNDMCFTNYLVGVGKFRLNQVFRRSDFEKNLRDAGLSQERISDFRRELNAKNGVIDVKGAPKEVLFALYRGFGFHSVTQPPQMSRGLHDKLVALTDEKLADLAKKLASNIDDPAAVQAAVQRLKDMRQIAHDYEKEGLIVEDEAWVTDQNVMVRERKPVFETEYAPSYLDDVVQHCTLSIFQRTFGDVVELED